MTKAVTRNWYRVALASKAGAPVLIAASGEHMGQAIAEAQAKIPASWPTAVEHATDAQIPLGESVGKGHVVMLGDAPADVAPFQWPVGVVPALTGASAFSFAAPGWTKHADNKLLVIEAQPAGDQVGELFMSLIERLPSADNLEVRVLDHFEDAGQTDVWLTSRVDAKKIIRFLDDHDEELFGNGHLELSVYVRAHKATLRMTEHKTIVWLAEEGALENEVSGWMRESKLPAVEQLVTARSGPHFHYRPGKSRDRKKLSEELYKFRLRKVDVVKKSARA